MSTEAGGETKPRKVRRSASKVEQPTAVSITDLPVETQANLALSPSFNAAVAIGSIPNRTGDIDPGHLMVEMQRQMERTTVDGKLDRQEGCLVAQAHTLDVVFSYYLRLASNTPQPLSQFEAYMRVALRAQNQSRMTIETLNLMKNPPSATFVRQANLANGPQQINNGSRVEKIQNPPNKLLEQGDGERLDFGAAQAPISADSKVATLGAVKRTANGGG